MYGYGSGGDDAERRRRRTSDAAHRRGARKWLNVGSRPPPAFARREIDEYERELAVRRRASSGSSAAGSSSVGASSSRLTPIKREPEELGPLAVKLEADAVPPRRGIIGPEDYLPPEQEDYLERAIMERSAREEEEAEARRRRLLETEEIFYEQGVAASQAHASKEADLRVMKAEQAAKWIDLVSDED